MNCTECQVDYIETPSGYVCPNGHGRLVMKSVLHKKSKRSPSAPVVSAEMLELAQSLLANGIDSDRIERDVARFAKELFTPAAITRCLARQIVDQAKSRPNLF